MSNSINIQRIFSRLSKRIEWLVVSFLWVTASMILTGSYRGTIDVITRWSVVIIGLIPLIGFFVREDGSVVTAIEKIQLRWVVVYATMLSLSSIPLEILYVDPQNSIWFSESLIVVGASLFGLLYHFISMSASIAREVMRETDLQKKRTLSEVENRYGQGALLLGVAATMSVFLGLNLRYDLIVEAADYSIFLLKLVLVLLVQTIFTLGFFRATKVSRWYTI